MIDYTRIRGHTRQESSEILGFNLTSIWPLTIGETQMQLAVRTLSEYFISPSSLFSSVRKFVVNFCQGLTLPSPPCSLPCCSLSACQNNEGKRNAAFGPKQGQPAQRPHEYSVLHMALCIRICIHLKALIRTLDLKRSCCGCCQRAS